MLHQDYIKSFYYSNKDHTYYSGADLGGGRGGGRPPPPPPLPQGFEPLPTQRVPPLVLFKKSIFGRPTLKIF